MTDAARLRYLSVCSGIEAATVAWHPLGWEPAAFSEIEAFPRAVLTHHYPTVPLHGDFTTIEGHEYGAIDILVGGTPCQDFSVAGLRAGIAGERGNLTLEFIRLLQRIKPKFFVWENVPGFLSLDGGNTARQVLDAFEEAGYVLDIDILDAQHHGLAQRRERVFVCGQLASDILEVRTISSALTIVQCLAESLQLALTVLSGRSATDSKNLTFDASEPLRSLSARMRLFGGASPAALASLLQKSLGALLLSCGCGQGVSASASGQNPCGRSEDTGSRASTPQTVSAAGCQSIDTSWNSTLAEACSILSECITSTVPRATTASKIYTCSQAILGIAEHIIHSPRSSPCFWSAASSSLTAIREFIVYARQAGSDLFTDLERVQSWRDFLEQATPACSALGDIGIDSFGEVFPLSESLLGHPAPRREAGEGTTAGTAQRPCGGGDSGLIPEVCPTLVANGNKTGGNRPPGTDGDTVTSLIVMASGQSNAPVFENDQCPALTCLHEAPIVAHSLRAEGFDASEDGTGRGTPLVPVSFLSNASFAEHGEDICGALRTENLHAIAFTAKDNGADAGDISPTLRSGGHDKSHANGGVMPAVAYSIMPMNSGQDYKARETDVAQPLMAGGPVGGNQGGDVIAQPVVFESRFARNGRGAPDTIVPPLKAQSGETGKGDAAPLVAYTTKLHNTQSNNAGKIFEERTTALDANSPPPALLTAMAVRRLTVRECERLQGFPDDYTLVRYRGKPAADGPRYKSLGNSMAVPVMAWIGQRIAMLEALT